MERYKTIVQIARIIIGCCFIISGIGKMMDSAAFGELISNYGFDWFSILSPIIILLELSIGLSLILGSFVRLCTMMSLALLLLFTVAFAYANISKGVENCGCFGNLTSNIPVWLTYTRNGILIFLSALLFKYESNQDEAKCSIHKAEIIILVLVVCAFWTGHTWQQPTFYANRFARPHRLIGKDVNDTPLSNYIQVSNDSTYVVWVFSYDCAGCINGIENIKQYQEGVADHFVPLAVTGDEDGRKRRLLNITFNPKEVGEGLVGFIKTVPTLLYIENGRIKYVIEGSVPNVYMFKSVYLEMKNNEILEQIK